MILNMINPGLLLSDSRSKIRGEKEIINRTLRGSTPQNRQLHPSILSQTSARQNLYNTLSPLDLAHH